MKRKSWDEYWMDIAVMVASRSGDPSTKVGAVIVGSDNRIISTGYNHYPAGYPKSREDWSKPTKYKYVSHAEMSAIIYSKQDLTKSTLYVTLSPCSTCAKLIASSGIKNVVFLEERKDVISDEILKWSGVNVRQINPKK
jgi:dCMP deaminase